MLQRDEIDLVYLLKEEYMILICNAHDVRLQSRMTGHEWIIISPYDGSSCEILHRHSARSPYHHQRGRYGFLSAALDYIRQHDAWFCEKMKLREFRIAEKKNGAGRSIHKIPEGPHRDLPG